MTLLDSSNLHQVAGEWYKNEAMAYTVKCN